jgi:hypothetical protein
MLGPGEYVADITEGVTAVEELPTPKVVHRSCNYLTGAATRLPRWLS